MTNLTAIFGSTRESAGDSEKLLELYWNRAELKKEFAKLRNDSFKLKDQIKEQQGLAARAEQKLELLENLLLNPDWVHTIVVFYQFKAMDAYLASKLARFAEQLKQQREQRQHQRLLKTWQGKRQKVAAQVKARLLRVKAAQAEVEARLEQEQQRYSAMGRLRRVLFRRSCKRLLDGIASELDTARDEEATLVSTLDKIARGGAPDAQGLDIMSKRSINFMILSFAQQIYQHFSVDNLAALGNEAAGRSIGSIRYGGKAECDRLLLGISRRRASMGKASDFAEILQQRAKYLSERARFRDDADAVPLADSVKSLIAIDSDGTVVESEANLLGEDYWGLSMLLSR